ncbi:thioesterase II family protein [Paenibacillus apiarius]|uniref:thioesterase II family protein n=1 Tax=Paenibacillus apiarius TaxID=46240 RepID=UPI0023430C3C|nr:thioesterase domain-containing protein [Paenibacillus apiarius]
MSIVKLFCVPYAGGSAMIYNPWKHVMGDAVELVPLELSGRGRRFGAPFYKSIRAAVEDVAEQIIPHVDDGSYALWGHSMGAIIVYELCHYMRQQGHPLPVHLFCSGSSAPRLRKKDKPIHDLPEEQFLKEIEELEGTPQEFFEHKELIDLYLPILRNDFMIIEQYEYEEKAEKLNTDLSVLYGSGESFVNEVQGWETHTSTSCRLHEFQGGHFFLFDHVQPIANVVKDALLPYSSSRAELIRSGDFA